MKRVTKKLIKTAPGYVERTLRTKGMGVRKRCGVCQITKAIKHFEVKREVCNECRKRAILQTQDRFY
jgi:hypothetical protein